jgi:hypothetical protein
MRYLLVGAAAVVLAACGMTDPNHLETELMPGALSFDFTGAGASGSTSFNATGIVSSVDPEWGTTPLAVATVSSLGNTVTIVAGTPKSGTKWDQVFLKVKRVAAGVAPIDTTCFGISSCGGTTIQIEFSADHAISLEMTPYTCALTRGTVSIVTITERRISGTFSGTGLCTTPANATSPFTVTNGSFDVGVAIPGKSLPKA